MIHHPSLLQYHSKYSLHSTPYSPISSLKTWLYIQSIWKAAPTAVSFHVDNSLFDPSWLILVSFDQITPHNPTLVLESNNQSPFAIDSREKRFFYLDYSLEWGLLKGISHWLWADRSVNDRINEIDSLNHIIGLAINNWSNHSIFLNRKEFERLPTTMVSLL